MVQFSTIPHTISGSGGLASLWDTSPLSPSTLGSPRNTFPGCSHKPSTSSSTIGFRGWHVPITMCRPLISTTRPSLFCVKSLYLYPHNFYSLSFLQNLCESVNLGHRQGFLYLHIESLHKPPYSPLLRNYHLGSKLR